MNKTRVLYISYDGLTDPLGQSQVLPYLIQLSRLNYEITILSTEKKENFLKNESIIRGLCNECNISWEYVKYTKTPPVLSTIKDIKVLRKKAESLYHNKSFNIVHCRSYISSLVGLYLMKEYGVKFIFDMRGFWADERIDGGIWNMQISIFRWIYSYFKKKEKEYLLNADAIISLTFNGKNEINSWDYMKEKKDNITVIPCCADLSHFDYNKILASNSMKLSLGIPEENNVICYLGSIGTWYMMPEMLEYFKVHLRKHPRTSFLWVTKDNPDSIILKAKELGIENSIVIKPSERAELPSLLSVCDASIFFIKPLFSKKASSPTKMAELLGMGIPLICNSNVGDTDEIVKKEKVGLVVNDFSEEAYKKVVDEFEELLSTPKARLRGIAQQYFSLEGGVEKYANVYKKLS